MRTPNASSERSTDAAIAAAANRAAKIHRTLAIGDKRARRALREHR